MARVFGGVGVDSFMKNKFSASFEGRIKTNRKCGDGNGPGEGLQAHAAAIEIRLSGSDV
jgi:hypothetical protein